MNRTTPLVALVMLIGAACPGLASVGVERLRCEYLNDPRGIDVAQPRLGWVLQSAGRGQKQTAYRVLVASSSETLAKDQGDLWDSGRVASDQTIQVKYAGKPLTSRAECFWKVQVYDKDGQPSPWSQPAIWTMGLLEAADWQAAWIADSVPPKATLHRGYLSSAAASADTTKWVVIDLGGDRSIDAVQLDPAQWENTQNTSAYLFPVRFKIELARKSDFSDARTVVDKTGDDIPAPVTQAQLYTFAPVSVRYARLTVTRLADRGDGTFGFALSEMEVLSTLEGWGPIRQNVAKLACKVTAADSIESDGWSRDDLVDARVTTQLAGNDPTEWSATMLRREFDVGGPIKRAVVSVTGLGVYELRINGQRVGDHLLAPEWTRYSKRIQYQTYDVTDLVHDGQNAVGAQLCGGWWTGPLWVMSTLSGARCCLLMRLDIERTDGTTQTVVTDPSWQVTDAGPIRRSGIYFGETYDATREMPGWDQPGFATNNWRSVQVLPYPVNSAQATLVAQPNEPIRIINELRPVGMTEPKPGVYVFDMGQNMVGWCRFKANAPAGTKITLRHAEVLDDEGMIYTANLRGAAQINEYTWRGGEAVLEPHFTYCGFRYVEVTGLPGPPDADAIVGCVFHSSATEAGTFSCSNDLINKIMHCVEWTQRGNMMGIPTDCPQRSEREGWMGDIQAFSQTAIFNYDMAAFFTKWVRDIRDSQADDGRYPDAAPHPGDPNGIMSGAPAWADAGTIVPWRVFQNYGDVSVLQEHFESAKRWVEFIYANNPDLIWRNKRGGDYGDWLNGDLTGMQYYPRGISAAPKELFATAFFAHSVEIVAKMAKVLGSSADAAKYSALFEGIKAAFNQEYVATNGRIAGDTQAGYALALDFDLLDESLRPKATEHLLEAIKNYNGHPSTGIQASHRMMLALSENGRHDEASRLINLRTVPSWGYMVDMGATTIWERWDCFVEGLGVWGGFQHPDMNSFNHWAFGSVGEWVWRELAGINPDDEQPGYKHFFIRPRLGGDLTWGKGRYDSIRGPIISDWTNVDGRLQLHVEVPVNTTAAVYFPDTSKELVTEGGTPAANVEGVEFMRMEGSTAIFKVGSGQYDFQAELRPQTSTKLDYSDTFTVGAAGAPSLGNPRPDGMYANNTYGGYTVESAYGLPAVTWHSIDAFSFNSPATVLSQYQYPGNTDNSGAETGMAQTGGDNWSIAYGLRTDYIVQADFNWPGPQGVAISSLANAGDRLPAALGGLTVIFRKADAAAGNQVSLLRDGTGGGGLETPTGIDTGIDASDTSWHNLGVRFNQAGNSLSVFVDRVLKGTLDLSTFAGGAYKPYSNAAVGIGGLPATGLHWVDNFQVGSPPDASPPQPVKLQTAWQGDELVITWSGSAMVYEAPEITGPWTAVRGANSPYVVLNTVDLIDDGGVLDYRDTFTVGAGGAPSAGNLRPDGLYANNTYGGYTVESTYGGVPSATWLSFDAFSFNSPETAVSPQYPGNVGNPGAQTGLAQTGGDNWSIAYGLRTDYIVQADFNWPGPQGVAISSLANAGDRLPTALGGLTVIFRKSDAAYRNQVSLLRDGTGGGGLETPTGIDTGIDASDTSWHNLGVRFNQAGNSLSVFVDRVLKGTLDLSTFAGGAYKPYSNAAVGIGGLPATGLHWVDNFGVGTTLRFKPYQKQHFYRLLQ